MRRRRLSMLYPAAFTASALVHATLLATLSRTSLTGRAASLAREPSAVPVVLDLALGLETSQVQSPVWVGFTEAQKHLAAPGEIDQAAFTDEPQGDEPAPQLAAGANGERAAAKHEAAPETEHDAIDETVSDLLGVARLAAAEEVLQRETESESVAAANEASETPERPDSPPTSPDARAERAMDALTKLVHDVQEALEKMSAANEKAARPPSPPSSPPASAGDETLAMNTRAGGQPSPGALSDRESDATSAIDVPREHWQLGKPLAARGLELKPRRPDVTILTSLTAWPRNPVCRITFERDGVPKKAELLRTTGHGDVDAAIEASLYRWRAAGKPLEALKDGDTIEVTIRLVINPERKVESTDDKTS